MLNFSCIRWRALRFRTTSGANWPWLTSIARLAAAGISAIPSGPPRVGHQVRLQLQLPELQRTTLVEALLSLAAKRVTNCPSEKFSLLKEAIVISIRDKDNDHALA